MRHQALHDGLDGNVQVPLQRDELPAVMPSQLLRDVTAHGKCVVEVEGLDERDRVEQGIANQWC
jgi:hypothetical protein